LYSFLLASINLQSTIIEFSIADDSEIKDIDGHINEVNTKLNNLHKEHEESMRETTLEDINLQITFNENLIKYYNNKRDKRELELKSINTKKIDSKNIMYAIPNAFRNKRFIDLFIFGLMSLGIQALIASSILKPKTRKRR